MVFSLLLVLKALPVQISGKISLHNSWQPVLFLASVDSPQDLHVASPDFIIAKTFIQPDGSFLFNEITLPDEPRFYRVYLVKSENAIVEFNANVKRNFFHILANNSSDITFNALATDSTFQLTNVNETENLILTDFELTLQKRKAKIGKDISKAQQDFIQLDIENYIRNFVDTCPVTMAALFALYNLDEKETDFLRNPTFYFNFQKRINAEFPNHRYTEAYNNLLNDLVGFRDLVCEIPGVAPKWKDNLLLIESGLIMFLVVLLLRLWRKLKKLKKPQSNAVSQLDNLTQKEKQILKLLASGKTNKESA